MPSAGNAHQAKDAPPKFPCRLIEGGERQAFVEPREGLVDDGAPRGDDAVAGGAGEREAHALPVPLDRDRVEARPAEREGRALFRARDVDLRAGRMAGREMEGARSKLGARERSFDFITAS
jgi:hypothetical protein